MADEKKSGGIFKKVLEAGEVALESYIAKSRSDIASEEDNGNYRKSVYSDITYYNGAQGYQEKSSTLSYIYQVQMSKRCPIVSAIIQTLQNKAAAYAVISRDLNSKGFRI